MSRMSDKQLTNHIVQQLDKELESSAREGEALLAKRLLAMRTNALNHIPETAPVEASRRGLVSWAWPALAVSTCAALLASILVIFPTQRGVDESPALVLSELDLLTNAEDLEMLESDVEFYLWLEAEQDS